MALKGIKQTEEHKRKRSEALKLLYSDKTKHPAYGKPGHRLGKKH